MASRRERAGARGALLFYSCVPVSEFGPGWPEGVPAQVHGMDADPIFVGEGDIDAARELVSQAKDAELFLYPGDQHYFADSSLPTYDPDEAIDADVSALDQRRGEVEQAVHSIGLGDNPEPAQRAIQVVVESWATPRTVLDVDLVGR